MYDFFDYLAGEKLELPEEKAISDEMTVLFKFNQPLPKPNLYKYKKSDTKEVKEEFKPIKLKEIAKKSEVKIKGVSDC